MAAKIKRLTEEERRAELKAYAFTEGLRSFFGEAAASPEIPPQGVVLQTTRVVPDTTPPPQSVVLDTTPTPLSVVSQTTPPPQSVVSDTTPTPQSVVPQTTRVVPDTTRVVPQTTPLPLSVVSDTTPTPHSVVPQTTPEGVSVVSQTTRVVPNTTRVVPQTTPLPPFLGETRDFYLIGFWYVLKGLFPDGHGTKSLRQLASTLNINAGNLCRLIKQAESASLIRTVSDKYGTYFEIQNPGVLCHRQHLDDEEEEVFKKQLPLPYGKDFQKMIGLRDGLEAIFWGCLAAGRSTDELSGTTVDYLIELSRQRSSEYVAGVLVKYIKEARHPLTFLQTVFQKEPDPLSQTEIKRGRETLEAGAKLLQNINKIDELGLNGMRNFIGLFAGLDLGKTIESARVALESLKEKRTAFQEKWGVS